MHHYCHHFLHYCLDYRRRNKYLMRRLQWLDACGFGTSSSNCMRIVALLLAVSLHICFSRFNILLLHPLDAGVATTDVEAALMSRSMCDGQGLLSLTADSLVALQLPTPALRLLHSSLDALRSVLQYCDS